MNARTLIPTALVALVVLGTVAKLLVVDLRRSEAEVLPPSVVLAVLGGVRADHTSICGYHRPTTPVLAELVRGGASHTCRAYAPGSWSLPSHASLLTGLPVVEHGARSAEQAPLWADVYFSPLPAGISTLAERLGERGYQTALVSGHPLVSEHTGLARGFEVTRTAGQLGDLFGDRVVYALRGVLRRADRRPLFLVVSIGDAHEPRTPVPPGLGWLPERDGISLYDGGEQAPVWDRFIGGEVGDEERLALLEHLTDLYDHGVLKADYVLGGVLDELEAHGRLGPGSLVVITSDHGEYLGEHGLLDHGRAVWDENQRVPLVVVADAPPSLPEPLAAISAYHLALDGRLPEPPAPVVAAAWPDPMWRERSGGALGGSTTVAAWRGLEQRMWTDGELRRYDLERGEEIGQPGEPWPELHQMVEAVLAQAAPEPASDASTEPLEPTAPGEEPAGLGAGE